MITTVNRPTHGGAIALNQQPLAAITATYIRLKTERGDWFGQTVHNNRCLLWDFVAQLPRAVAKDPRRVKRHHIQAWVDANPTHSMAYKRGRRSAVRGLFRWMHAEGRIPMDPSIGVHVGDVPDSVPRSFNDDEVEQLFAVAVRDPRELVCVSLCWNDGLRRIEVARVLIEDIDERTRTLRVRGKFYRGEVSRVIALDPQTMAAIDAYLRSEPARTGPLVRSRGVRPGLVLTKDSIGRIIGDVIKDAGLKKFPYDGRSSHAGRHTSATQAVEAHVEPEKIKRQYGWTSDAMLNRYTKGAALDLHEIHQARAQRRERLRAPIAAVSTA